MDAGFDTVVKDESRILVAYLDPGGLIRAWAKGPAARHDEVRAEADRQLVAYRQEKRALGDPLADAEFTIAVYEV